MSTNDTMALCQKLTEAAEAKGVIVPAFYLFLTVTKAGASLTASYRFANASIVEPELKDLSDDDLVAAYIDTATDKLLEMQIEQSAK